MVVLADGQQAVLGGAQGEEDGACDEDVAGLLRRSRDGAVEDVSGGEPCVERNAVDLVEGAAVVRHVVCVVVVQVQVERPVVEVVEGVLGHEGRGMLQQQQQQDHGEQRRVLQLHLEVWG